MLKGFRARGLAAFCSVWAVLAPAQAEEAPANPFAKIKHWVIIYGENLSFDAIFSNFPGAHGQSEWKDAAPQTDHDGKVFEFLPRARLRDAASNGADYFIPEKLSNAPFALEKHMSRGSATGDLVHRFFQEQLQINGGKNDRFAAVSNAGGLAMAYYDDHDTRLWKLASEFTLLDNFYHAAFGGSFMNHFWLVCACTPVYGAERLKEDLADKEKPLAMCGTGEDGLPKKISKVEICLEDKRKDEDKDSRNIKLKLKGSSPASALFGPPEYANDGQVTWDGYAVNTMQPAFAPRADDEPVLPAQTLPTIGDRFNEKKVSWAWYAGGWDDAVKGKLKAYKPPENFQPHHQPFNYFENFKPGSPARERLKDEKNFIADIKAGNLPAVSFWKPVGRDTMHPGYTDLWTGDEKLGQVVDMIRASPAWGETAIIITFDENGGAWDHMPPPVRDRWGPGLRVPALVISPYARKGQLDHTQYDTVTILRTLERALGVDNLNEVDKRAPDLLNAFDFTQQPKP